MALGIGGGGSAGVLVDDRLIGGAGVIEVALELAGHGVVEEFAGEAFSVLGVSIAAFFEEALDVFDIFEGWVGIADGLEEFDFS